MDRDHKDKMDEAVDVDSASFSPERYVSRLLKEGSLKRIMQADEETARESRMLHSEMQTLVYENYNKFISATETVRKMRADFELMDEEVGRLELEAESIAEFSDRLDVGRRKEVDRLCDTARLLARLEFAFMLPKRLEDALAEGRLEDAVDDYLRAEPALRRPSFAAVADECRRRRDEIVARLEARLDEGGPLEGLAQSARLLRRLGLRGRSPRFLAACGPRLRRGLDALKEPAADRLDWVERANSGLLADLGRVAASHGDAFAADEDEDGGEDARAFGDKILREYLEIARERLVPPRGDAEPTEPLARALDKFHHRVRATGGHLRSEAPLEAATAVVVEAILGAREAHSSALKASFRESLLAARRSVADDSADLARAVSSLITNIVDNIEGALVHLEAFSRPDLSFSPKADCSTAAAKARADLVFSAISDACATAAAAAATPAADDAAPARLPLLLSRFCRDLHDLSIGPLCRRAGLEGDPKEAALKEAADAAGRALLNAYANRVGLKVSQMLRVSVLSREWSRAPEPRGVRAVARRVLEALAAADKDAARLYESRVAATGRSSDSSRRTRSIASTRRPLDSHLGPNVGRLFSDRIEIFGPVEPTKASIMTAVVKIGLKTFLECVRLRTYSRYGLQQMQVDVHYLQLYLWQYVHDENLVHVLLEEVLASAVNRCVDPRLMEPSIVEIICERG